MVDVSGRFLVAIVDATRSYIQFGLRMSSSVEGNASVISVYYGDKTPASRHWDSPVSSWTVPSLVGRWTSIIVEARGRHMSLLVDCHATTPVNVEVPRSPRGLTFDSASSSTVYVAQAGPFATHFEVNRTFYIINIIYFHQSVFFSLARFSVCLPQQRTKLIELDYVYCSADILDCSATNPSTHL